LLDLIGDLAYRIQDGKFMSAEGGGGDGESCFVSHT